MNGWMDLRFDRGLTGLTLYRIIGRQLIMLMMVIGDDLVDRAGDDPEWIDAD